MKLKLQQDYHVTEPEITIVYDKMNHRLDKMIHTIKQYEYRLEGISDGKKYQVPLDQVYYFESVDGKSFFYTNEKVFETRDNLSMIEKKYEGTSIIRIAKNNLVNAGWLRCVKPYPNHRLLAELKNGEELIVSRKYILDLKEWARRSSENE